MPSSTSSPSSTGALAVVESSPLNPSADASGGVVRVQFTPVQAAPGEKAAQIDVVTVEARATEYADGTKIRSWTRTEQHIEVEAPEHNTVTLEQVAQHAPVLSGLGGSSEMARLLKLDNDDDYTDDDFDDDSDDDDDDDDVDLDDDGEPIVAAPAPRALPAAPVVASSTHWNPPFTTIRHGNITVTVPDIGAIIAQLSELLSNTQRHQQTALAALRLVEPLAQKAMELGYSQGNHREALQKLHTEASALLADPLRRAEEARSLASIDLDHGQRISQRALGSPRVKEKLDALVAAATSTQESSQEAARLLRALRDAAG